jgi:hypothetical protein
MLTKPAPTPATLYLISVAPNNLDIRDEKEQKWFYTKDVPEDIADIIQSRSYTPDADHPQSFNKLYQWIFEQRPFHHWTGLGDGTLLQADKIYVVNLSECCFHF